MKKLGAFLSVLLCLPLVVRGEIAATLQTGEIAGARFTVALPKEWKGDILLLAHGYRPDSAPLLADLDVSDRQVASLLRDGWIVASTSFRRNGLILADAIDDLDRLKAKISADQGQPKRVFVQGESMGGTIAVLIAERETGGYAGALAIGAALHIADGTNGVALTHRPKIPLVFLSNRSEFDGPKDYANPILAEPRPILRRVERDGHVNVNSSERLAALKSLVHLVAGKREPASSDGTRLPPRTRSTATFADGSATGRVAKVNPFYGNLTLDLLQSDLSKLGIKRGDRFRITLGKTTAEILYGSDFSDVARGEWVAFIDSEGRVFVSKNWENAAASTGVREGDAVVLIPGK
jgi:pimeloyl-ACP methyl ester carboxylesterase